MDEARGRVAYRVLHRTVKTDPPAAIDFMSNKALGKPPRNAELREPVLHDGLSVWDSLESAIAMARQFPQHGAFIAELTIAPDSMITIRKTRGPGHFTIFGHAEAIRACVTRVFPVGAQEEGRL